jgi:hypothetical protein
MDWLIMNERWISLHRINGLIKYYDEQTARSLCAVARYMDRQTTHSRWKTLAQCQPDTVDPTPFFQRTDFKDMPVIGEPDPLFHDAGLVRSPVALRGLSKPVLFTSPPNVIFQLRTLFGVSPRAELIAFLLSHDQASVSDLMHRSGYSRPSIHEVMNDLAKGGFISVFSKNNRNIYSLDISRWEKYLSPNSMAYQWPDWAAVYAALRKLYGYLHDIQNNPVSDYILRSKSVRLAAAMQHELAGSGFASLQLDPVDIDHVMDLLPQQILLFLDYLNNPV